VIPGLLFLLAQKSRGEWSTGFADGRVADLLIPDPWNQQVGHLPCTFSHPNFHKILGQ